MDKGLERAWDAAIAAVGQNAWLSIPLVVLGLLAYNSPTMLTSWLEHRRAMWKMRLTEQRRRESVEKRRKKPASVPSHPIGKGPGK